MINRLRIYILATSMIIICSCRNSVPAIEESEEHILDVVSAIDSAAIRNASEFIKSINYIPLETTPNSIIDRIDKFIIQNGKIYISDNNRTINIFDMKGRHLNTLNKMGRGSEEYTNISSFTIDSNGNILIMTPMDGILKYDPEMKFIRKIKSTSMDDGSYLSLTSIKDGLFISNTIKFDLSAPKQSLIIYDDSLNTRLSYISDIPIKVTGSGITLRANMHKYYIHDKQLKIYRNGNDTVFTVDIDNGYSKTAGYIMNYGRYSLSDDAANGLQGDPIDAEAISLEALVESKDHLFLRFKFRALAPEPFTPASTGSTNAVRIDGTKPTDRNTSVCAVYSKTDRTLVLLDQPTSGELGLKDNIAGGPAFWPDFMTQNQEMVTYYNAFELIALAKDGKIDPSLTIDLKEEDNPVIVIATLK